MQFRFDGRRQIFELDFTLRANYLEDRFANGIVFGAADVDALLTLWVERQDFFFHREGYNPPEVFTKDPTAEGSVKTSEVCVGLVLAIQHVHRT